MVLETKISSAERHASSICALKTNCIKIHGVIHDRRAKQQQQKLNRNPFGSSANKPYRLTHLKQFILSYFFLLLLFLFDCLFSPILIRVVAIHIDYLSRNRWTCLKICFGIFVRCNCYLIGTYCLTFTSSMCEKRRIKNTEILLSRLCYGVLFYACQAHCCVLHHLQLTIIANFQTFKSLV